MSAYAGAQATVAWRGQQMVMQERMRGERGEATAVASGGGQAGERATAAWGGQKTAAWGGRATAA